MKMNGGFEVTFTDRDDYDELLAQVRWGSVVICELHKRVGAYETVTEIQCNDQIYNGTEIVFGLKDFVEAIQVAENMLVDMYGMR